MIKRYDFNTNINLEKNIACIGYFDGVHKGHQELIKETVRLAKKNGLKAFVITFYPDPEEIVSKQKIKQITTLNQRIKLFDKFGIEGVVVLPFDEKMMSLSIDEFKKDIIDKLNIDTLVCGFDFTYGYKKSGNPNTLKKQGIKVKTIKEFTYYGKKVSSTRIREEINKKNYKLVNKLLGYEYK